MTITNSVLRALIAIYSLIFYARSWTSCQITCVTFGLLENKNRREHLSSLTIVFLASEYFENRKSVTKNRNFFYFAKTTLSVN